MHTLNGLHVLVTRPVHQAANFQHLLEQAGAIPYAWPLLAIRSMDTAPETLLQLRDNQHYQLVIFISANAVQYGLQLLPDTNGLSGVKLGAIGKQTAHALQAHGLSASLVPPQGFSSEDFLDLPEVQQLSGQRVLIVRGDQGRELLAETLQQRGARVDYANVYQRICPANDPDGLKQLHDRQQLDIICLTSSEALHNLLFLLHGAPWVKTIPLLAGSGRIAEDARRAGFTNTIIVADSPADAAMLDALLHWQQENRYDRQAGSQRN